MPGPVFFVRKNGVSVDGRSRSVGFRIVRRGEVVRHPELLDDVADAVRRHELVGRLLVEDQFADAGLDIGEDFRSVGIVFVTQFDPREVVLELQVSLVIEPESDSGNADVGGLFHLFVCLAVYRSVADHSDLRDEFLPCHVECSEVLPAQVGDGVVLAGGALRRLFPAVREQTLVFLARQDRVERSLHHDHLCGFQLADDGRRVRVAAGNNRENAILEDSLAHLSFYVIYINSHNGLVFIGLSNLCLR